MSARKEEKILPVALPFVSQLNLSYDENNITISFASNSYIDNSDRKIYEYMLEGFDKNGIQLMGIHWSIQIWIRANIN